MSTTEATHDDNSDVPTVNSEPLDSLEGVRRAFSYLDDDYNDGDIYELSTLTGDEAVAIESRRSSFQHMDHLMEAHCKGYIKIGPITAQADRTLKIEVHER